jgi:hypothetical protein
MRLLLAVGRLYIRMRDLSGAGQCVKTPADNPKQRISTTFKFNANSLFIFSDVSHKYIDFCAVKAPCRVDVNDGSINGVFDWVSRKGKRIININRLTGAYFQIDTYEDLNDLCMELTLLPGVA